MTENQIWAIICLSGSTLFILLTIIFTLLKEKGILFISGFNTLSKEERKQYDTQRMSTDIRKSLFLWAIILLIGGILSDQIHSSFAMLALTVWIVLFFKDVKLDTKKAFEKYRL